MAGRQLMAIRETLARVRCDKEEAVLFSAEDFAVTKCAALTPELIEDLKAQRRDAAKAGEEGVVYEPPVPCTQDYTIRTHLLRIGNLALIGIDGELYTSHGLAVKAASPFADTFVINHDSSLRLDNPGYIADDETLGKVLQFALEDPDPARPRGGVPGGRVYTAPGTVKEALETSTRKLFS